MDQDVASHDSSHRRKEITQKQEPAVESVIAGGWQASF